MSIKFTNSSIAGSPLTVTYTVQAGDTIASVIMNFIAKLNTTAALQNVDINAWQISNYFSLDDKIYIGYPVNDIGAVTFATSKTGTGNETMTLSSVTNWSTATEDFFAENVTIQNWSVDGTNRAGDSSAPASGSMAFWVEGTAHSTIRNIHTTKWVAGSGQFYQLNYADHYEDLYDYFGGNDGWNAIADSSDTRSTFSNICSDRANGFGIGINGSYGEWSGVHSIGSTGRCIKLEGSLQTIMNGVSTGSCGDTGISITWGTWYTSILGASSIGVTCGLANLGVPIWFSGDVNRFATIMAANAAGGGASPLGCDTNDVSLAQTDTDNTFYGLRDSLTNNVGTNNVFH